MDAVVDFAGENREDRSTLGPREVLFHHVSTDEAYGSLGAEGLFTEITPDASRSVYSASKAASDHRVRAYHHTYGPYQFPEKLIHS